MSYSADTKRPQNRKVTDYYPIRRSSRKSKIELKVVLGFSVFHGRYINRSYNINAYACFLSPVWREEAHRHADDKRDWEWNDGNFGVEFYVKLCWMDANVTSCCSWQVRYIEGKGRGVFATQNFQKGQYVVEYYGDLLQITDAKTREALYAQDPTTGCYMYYFQYLSKTYW